MAPPHDPYPQHNNDLEDQQIKVCYSAPNTPPLQIDTQQAQVPKVKIADSQCFDAPPITKYLAKGDSAYSWLREPPSFRHHLSNNNMSIDTCLTMSSF